MILQVKARFERQIKQKGNSQLLPPLYANICAMLILLSSTPSCIAADEFRLLVNRGSERAQSGDFTKALYWYNKALQVNPRDADCNFDIAQVYLNLKQYQKARSYYAKTVEYDPKMGEAWNQLTSVCIQLNDMPAAELAQAKACESSPSCKHFNNLAKLYLQQGKFKQARPCLIKASTFPEAKLPQNKDIAENLKWADEQLKLKPSGE